MKLIRIYGVMLLTIAAAVACGAACTGAGAPTPEITGSTAAPTTARTIYTTDPVSVTFSAAMDEASVEAAFSVTGSDPVAGTLSWSDNTLTFTPDARWKTNHTYTLTVTAEAVNAKGDPLAEDYTRQFTPRINLHDVNGDHIDDFMLGSMRHDYNGTNNTGIAYLFLGKETWADVDLSAQPADATIALETEGAGVGLDAQAVGDINGDGYADMAVALGSGGGGAILIVNGAAAPEDVIVTGFDPNNSATFDVLNQFDGIALTPPDVSYMGFPVMPAGDVNGDGLADFLVAGGFQGGGVDDTRYWLVLGRTDAFPPATNDLTTMPTMDSLADAVYTVTGFPIMFSANGLPVAACDVNGDEYSDVIMAEPRADVGGLTGAGRVFVIAGSEAPASRDLRSTAADATILGDTADGNLGGGLGCGDVNGDGYGDILAGMPGYNTFVGRTYVIPGSGTLADIDLSATPPAVAFTGAEPSYFGVVGKAIGDVTGDGVEDILIGAPSLAVSGTQYVGGAYLFGGSSSLASVDLSAGGSALAAYTGPIPPNATSPGNASVLGMTTPVGDVNGDGRADILLGAPVASSDGILECGIVYLMFGEESPRSMDFETDAADATIEGAAAEDWCSIIMPLI